MKDKQFWNKFKELSDKEKAHREEYDFSFITDLEFKEVSGVPYITFDLPDELQQEDVDLKFQRVKNLLKQHNIDCDFDIEGMMGLDKYDAIFLKKLDAIIPIKQIEISILMKKRGGKK